MNQRLDEESPTLPLPPPRASRVSLEDLIETATNAARRAPLPTGGGVNPYPPIWVGIILYPPFVNTPTFGQVNTTEE
jgi:hypothetical protein